MWSVWSLVAHGPLTTVRRADPVRPCQSVSSAILARGLDKAYLGVDEGNVRAAALYLRLGYTPYDVAEESWDRRPGCLPSRPCRHSA